MSPASLARLAPLDPRGLLRQRGSQPSSPGPVDPDVRTLGRELLHSKTFVIGALILLFWVFDAIFWRALAANDPQTITTAALQSPSSAHWFGTDNLGRDVLARVLAGATSVLTVAPVATALSLLAGTALGLSTAYYGGLFDDAAMRVVDALLAFPVIVIAVLALAVLGPSEFGVIVVIAVLFAPVVARTARSAALTERPREYVAAARMRGESGPYIMAVEILPNIVAPLAVEASVRLAYAVFTSATLSFLSLGIQQPSPDWGLTISLGRPYLQIARWMVLFPAFALATVVVAIKLIADGLSRVLEQ